MSSISAISIAPDAGEWLAKSRRPRILHVFDQACNLINERGEVLSIVTLQIGNGPFNLVIEGDILFSKHLYVESPISILAEQLDLGDLSITIANAKPWHPQPDWESMHARRDDILNRLVSLRARSANQSPRKLDVASPQGTYLSSALANNDTSVAKTITSKLAGLGAGLTPSGDDFLLGAIYATWIIHPPEIAAVLAKEITGVAAPLTTSLSAAWLRSAGKGEAGILWHEYFEALKFVSRIGNPTYRTLIQEAMDNILSIGETSGADALEGFLAVCSAYKERIIDQCLS